MENNKSNRQSEMLKKFFKFFKQFRLKLSILNEHNSVNFLDMNLSLSTVLYELYTKSNTNLMDINVHSNHPARIKMSFVENKANRISHLSVNETIFNKHTNKYKIALNKAGYKINTKYNLNTHAKKLTSSLKNIIKIKKK